MAREREVYCTAWLERTRLEGEGLLCSMAREKVNAKMFFMHSVAREKDTGKREVYCSARPEQKRGTRWDHCKANNAWIHRGETPTNPAFLDPPPRV